MSWKDKRNEVKYGDRIHERRWMVVKIECCRIDSTLYSHYMKILIWRLWVIDGSLLKFTKLEI